MKKISLNGQWKVRHETLGCKGIRGLKKVINTDTGWIKAKVPGEIHLDLMRAGELDEPLVSLNAKKSRWPESHSWWFVRSFKIIASSIADESQQIVFDGLDLYAQIFLNGEFVGESKNAFIPQVFTVKHIVKAGDNKLVVRLTAGAELVPKALQPKSTNNNKPYGGRMKFPGISHLRKPQFSYGWDWVDALPNIGIWRDVRFESYSGIVFHDVHFNTEIDMEEVFLNANIVIENIHPWSERTGVIKLCITAPSGHVSTHTVNFTAQVGRSEVLLRMKIEDPKLWWPNGMGNQPLYHITVSTVCDEKISDKLEFDVGLRTVTIDRSAIATGGSRFCIKINGKDVFCKGGNWIPADAIVARVGKNKYEKLISEACNANFNMLRVWGGGVYESPHFYNACDRAGILVWQDFMFACSEYPDSNDEFRNEVRKEAETVVMALRHHPCIVLWCGNNENTWAFKDWWNKGVDLNDKRIRIGGSLIYNQILPDVCRTLDNSRPYWPSSPFGGDAPNSEQDGDCHWWDEFTMNKDINRRINHEVFDECKSRFVSEYGVIGPCHIDSIKQYLDKDELHIGTLAWQEHTNEFEKETIPAAIRRHYADPENLEIKDYIFYGQMFQASMYGMSIEALRFRKNDPRNDCQGALFWMYNDCWGETGWTPIDYYLRRKPSYYHIRNAYTPIKAIVRRRGDKLVTRVVNDKLEKTEITVHYGWMRIDGTDSKMLKQKVSIEGNSMMEIARERIPNSKVIDPRDWIYTSYITHKDIDSSPSIWLLLPFRKLSKPSPDISISLKGKMLELTSKTYCHGVYIKDNGKSIFADNYFDLLPGVTKLIECPFEKMPIECQIPAYSNKINSTIFRLDNIK